MAFISLLNLDGKGSIPFYLLQFAIEFDTLKEKNVWCIIFLSSIFVNLFWVGGPLIYFNLTQLASFK